MNLFLIFSSLFTSKVVKYNLLVTKEKVNPDGFSKKSILINGRMPGPELRANAGDELIINVFNFSNENFTLHLHGIDQLNSNKYDGVPYLTQDPILPCGYFRYKIKIGNQPGTYYYHSHSHMQADTAYGALIIDDPNYSDKIKFDSKYRYDYEKILLLSDYYHKSEEEIIKGLLNVPFKWIGDPNSLLVNGINHKYRIDVKSNKVYRIRLIGATGLSYIKFEIAHHKLLIIEVDGVLTEPTLVDSVKVNSGQRISVLLYTNKTEYNSFPVHLNTLYRNDPGNGLIRLIYVDSLVDNPVVSYIRGKNQTWDMKIKEPSISKWYQIDDDHFYKINTTDIVNIPIKIRQTYNDERKLKWFLNHSTYFLKLNSTYRIILQMYANEFGKCEQHPMHLHGQPFYVIGNGLGKHSMVDFDKSSIIYENKYKNPILRDTVTIFPDSNSFGKFIKADSPCGWTELIFKAKNLGKWLFHCHISSHMVMGMSTVFEILK